MQCKTCGRTYFDYRWNGKHVCPPIWLVWCLDDNEEEVDAVGERADDAGEAVEQWAQRYDSDGEHAICHGQIPLLAVRNADTRAVSYHHVRGELVPEYWSCDADVDIIKREIAHCVARGRAHEGGKLYGILLAMELP